MKANRPYRNFVMAMGAMIFLSIAAAHANQLGTVNFANGSTTPAAIPQVLLSQVKGATTTPGHVVLLRAGASPVGGRAYNFVLSGERAAAVRDALVKAGVPRKKIVSDFVGIVHRGSAANDRAVIVDATTRAALAGQGPQVAVPQATPAQIRKLQAEIAALQAAQAYKPKAAIHKTRVRNWIGSAFYLQRSASVNSTTAYLNPFYLNGVASYSASFGDTYEGTGFGFALARRPFFLFGMPVRVRVSGIDQKWQVQNPVEAGQVAGEFTASGLLLRPLLARDAVSSQFLQADVSTTSDLFGVMVSPGVRVGWTGVQSLAGSSVYTPFTCTAGTGGSLGSGASGGGTCGGYTDMYLNSTNSSSIRVTPSLKIGYGPVSLAYSQSPWGGAGYNAPRVIMGQVDMGRVVHVTMGVALPDCPSICQGGAGITQGKIVSVSLQKWGWGINLTGVMGEKFMQGGAVAPAPLAQMLAPYNPARPWDSYNPGYTIEVSKALTKNVAASILYQIQSEAGSGYSPAAAGLYQNQASATIKTMEISLKGRF
ncbi:OmpA family protein [Acidiferrobacter thiooxydans]